ncbi:hypothetical protein CHS0354_031689 [Potamilus streckersoni]|uniref:Uncharacterized protein n=1 Tax=Potamilus streckersoni TaxID=2493646 RepID=A0AAE0W1K4_9BIVA|nr:hypothetical protein CHS0354_031689 [Potamilus streckersoni]
MRPLLQILVKMWQMMFLSGLIFSAFCLQIHGGSFDGCMSNIILPQLVQRDKSYTVIFGEQFVSDDTLIEGWYMVPSGFQVSTNTSNMYIGSCGTYFPIWLNGSHPFITGDEVEVTACRKTFFHLCESPFPVKIRSCGSYYVYYLNSTQVNSAYCIGTHPSKAGDEVTTIACVRTFSALCDPSFEVRIKNCEYYYAYYLQNTTLNSAFCIERLEIHTTGISTVSSKTTLQNTSRLNFGGTTSSRPNSTAQTKTENYSDSLFILKTVAIVISTVVILPMAVIALLFLWKNKTRKNRFINALPLEKKNIPVSFVESSNRLDTKIILMSDPVIFADMDAGHNIPIKA